MTSLSFFGGRRTIYSLGPCEIFLPHQPSKPRRRTPRGMASGFFFFFYWEICFFCLFFKLSTLFFFFISCPTLFCSNYPILQLSPSLSLSFTSPKAKGLEWVHVYNLEILNQVVRWPFIICHPNQDIFKNENSRHMITTGWTLAPLHSIKSPFILYFLNLFLLW